jgi:hypothetical protein
MTNFLEISQAQSVSGNGCNEQYFQYSRFTPQRTTIQAELL